MKNLPFKTFKMIDYQFPIDDISTLKVYDDSFLESIFETISYKSNVGFQFSQGGCQQRSHVISLILSKQNIEHSKIWLFSPASLFDYDNRALFVDDIHGLAPENTIHWNYHTAPIIKINYKNKPEIFVIDPSINRESPIILREWLKKIGNSDISKYTFLDSKKYFFNCKYNDSSQLTNVFDGSFFEYTNPAKDNLVLEKGLAVNDMAFEIYNTHLKPLIENYDPKQVTKLYDLKEIFGNATALDLLFSQNLSGNTDNTSFRYVFSKYSDIMIEAKKIYNNRLSYWTLFVNDLMN